MAYRYLVDDDGVTWRVWDVQPSPIDRRHQIRRIKVMRIRHAERRTIPTRRVDMARSRLYFPPTEKGWLCFESDTGRLRLRSYPENWPVLSDEHLDALRREASLRD
jgi:hypothetical protein